MRRVLIGTPAHAGTLEARYVFSLTQTIRAGIKALIDIEERFICYGSILQTVRNDLVWHALDRGFDDLVFIDADQDWKPEDFLKLLSHDVDCVGAAIVKKTEDQELYNVFAPGLDMPVDLKTGLLVVPGVGTGFLRLSRKALQVLWDGAEEYTIDHKPAGRWIFDIRPNAEHDLVGEDILVATKLNAAGIRVHVDPTIVCGHIGVKRYQGDFGSYIARIKANTRAANVL